MGATFLRKYNTLTVTGTTAIRVPMIKRAVVDFAVGADWTPASGDCKIAIDGAAAANVTNLPTAVAMGNTAYWEFILTAAELTCKSSIVTVADSATKAVEDQAFVVETFGNASAMYQADLSAANLPANVTQLLGTAWLTPGVAGTPDVNAKQLGGTAQTGRDVGASVLLSAGSGAGQLDFTSGVVKANLAQILGTALTETAGQIAAAFKQFFNIATPAATMDHGILVDTVTTYTGNTKQTGDGFARLGAPAGASIAADIAAAKVDTAAIKVQTDKLAFTVPNQVDSNVLDWKSSAAPAMTGDAFARLGTPAGASVSADMAALKALVPAALVGGRMDSSVGAIAGTVAGATALDRSTRGIVIATVGAASSTTSIVTSAMTPASAVADQFKGRIVTFDLNTTTANLRGQSTDITANTLAGILTVTALTDAPSSGDTFTVT